MQPIHAPITPRTQTGKLPWAKSPKEASTKDAPVRAADATEHLKTVWSTTANQSEKPSSTILEEFPSDLVAPVPVRDTKLEQTVATSTHIVHPKISLSDVTRSFQQVPINSGSSNNVDSSRNNASSHPTSPPTLRQPQTLGQPQPPMMPGGMRPAYGGYPSPMMSSPSPNMMYAQAMTPSPIPRPMLPATSPQYPAPMWMAMPPPGMRPMPSPYAAQLMPYPPGAPMYAPPMNMQGSNPTQPNGAQGRPPGMMMSPVAAPAQASMPMYATSPVLMPAMPAMQTMPGGPGAYPGAGAPNGRGQQQRGGYESMPGMMQQASYGPSGYSTAPPNSYARSSW